MHITGTIDGHEFVAIEVDNNEVQLDVDDNIIHIDELFVRKQYHPLDGHHRRIEASEGLFELYLVMNYLSDDFNIEFETVPDELLEKFDAGIDGRMTVVN